MCERLVTHAFDESILAVFGFFAYKRDMRETAVVVPMAARMASSYALWSLNPIAGNTVLAHLFERLKRGLPAGEFEFYALCEQGFLVEKLQAGLGQRATIFSSKTGSPLERLSEFITAHPHLKTLCIFPEQAIFPDCRLSLRLIELHRQKRAEATFAEGYPPGLLPEIYQTSTLERLEKMGLPEEVSVELSKVIEKSNELFADDPESHFKLLKVSAETFQEPSQLQKLPSALLVCDARSQLAAERTLLGRKNAAPTIDSADAYFYKQEYLAIIASENFLFSVDKPPMGKIPILFNSKFGAYTGAEECFFKIISRLDRQRFAPIAALPYEGIFSDKLRQAGIPVEIGGFRMDEVSPWSMRYFRALLTHTGARIVHIDSEPAMPLILVANENRIPIVCNQNLLCGRNAPSGFPFADRIISVSQMVTNDLLRSDIDPAKVVTLFEGLDVTSFDPASYDQRRQRMDASIPLDAKVITMVARIMPDKKVDMIIRILPEIIKKFPQALFLVVGEHYPKSIGYRLQIERLIAQLGVADHVRFWGFEAEMPKIYALSDVLVSCHSNEAVGHSILEALAMKVPVVVPNRGGHNEILRHNENAILYKVNNEQSLTTELIRLLGNPDYAAKLAAAGRQTAESLDLPRYIEQLQRIYEEILS